MISSEFFDLLSRENLFPTLKDAVAIANRNGDALQMLFNAKKNQVIVKTIYSLNSSLFALFYFLLFLPSFHYPLIFQVFRLHSDTSSGLRTLSPPTPRTSPSSIVRLSLGTSSNNKTST
uniref:ANK_REP_REGION domain-containing protein n=1 Tax=Heterorhabditis bacteriophora TaxID=37862 RepID=A0A1I7XMM6_HETBA